MADIINRYKILLASQSPRRQFLIKEAGFQLETVKIEVEETFDSVLRCEQIPLFLAQKKAGAYNRKIKENELLVTADTIVWVNNHVLNKPESKSEAREMLKELSNNSHTVYTAVCVKSFQKELLFFESSEVRFNKLEEKEIEYYLDHYKPYDKAGAYGIQEWIGYIGIRKIDGCFYNVMGFPLSRFWQEVKHL